MRRWAVRYNERMIVKVQLPAKGEVGGASLYSQDRSIMMPVPLSLASRRLKQGQREGYFSATFEHDILELGERVPDPDPKW